MGSRRRRRGASVALGGGVWARPSGGRGLREGGSGDSVPMSREGARALGRIDDRRVLVDGARPDAIAATLAS